MFYLIIIDGFMYIVIDLVEANQFFQLVNYLYKRNFIMVASNKRPINGMNVRQ